MIEGVTHIPHIRIVGIAKCFPVYASTSEGKHHFYILNLEMKQSFRVLDKPLHLHIEQLINPHCCVGLECGNAYLKILTSSEN